MFRWVTNGSGEKAELSEHEEGKGQKVAQIPFQFIGICVGA